MRQITISDLCELTGYSRDQIRGFLAELPRFACRTTEARVARVYSNQDVMLIVLFCQLETLYGLKRSFISTLSEQICSVLLAPRKVAKQAWLVIRMQNGTCEYVDKLPVIDNGLVVPLSPIFIAIDSYLLPTPLIQRDIGFSATGAFNKKRSTAIENPHSVGGEQRIKEPQTGRTNHG
jgi:hypothetical protein